MNGRMPYHLVETDSRRLVMIAMKRPKAEARVRIAVDHASTPEFRSAAENKSIRQARMEKGIFIHPFIPERLRKSTAHSIWHMLGGKRKTFFTWHGYLGLKVLSSK